jgi:6-pyruvoyltetrahydropterin/6-carboxytetrahydropterin synthase
LGSDLILVGIFARWCGIYNKGVMFISRKAEFSASHACRLPNLSDEQNREIYGAAANPRGHGHNYIFEVTLKGDPDPVRHDSGSQGSQRRLESRGRGAVRSPLPQPRGTPFDRVVPTPENIAIEIWRRPTPPEQARAPGERASVDTLRSILIQLTRQYKFAASHRLHRRALEADNHQTYGKCNNPFGPAMITCCR